MPNLEFEKLKQLQIEDVYYVKGEITFIVVFTDGSYAEFDVRKPNQNTKFYDLTANYDESATIEIKKLVEIPDFNTLNRIEYLKKEEKKESMGESSLEDYEPVEEEKAPAENNKKPNRNIKALYFAEKEQKIVIIYNNGQYSKFDYSKEMSDYILNITGYSEKDIIMVSKLSEVPEIKSRRTIRRLIVVAGVAVAATATAIALAATGGYSVDKTNPYAGSTPAPMSSDDEKVTEAPTASPTATPEQQTADDTIKEHNDYELMVEAAKGLQEQAAKADGVEISDESALAIVKLVNGYNPGSVDPIENVLNPLAAIMNINMQSSGYVSGVTKLTDSRVPIDLTSLYVTEEAQTDKAFIAEFWNAREKALNAIYNGNMDEAKTAVEDLYSLQVEGLIEMDSIQTDAGPVVKFDSLNSEFNRHMAIAIAQTFHPQFVAFGVTNYTYNGVTDANTDESESYPIDNVNGKLSEVDQQVLSNVFAQLNGEMEGLKDCPEDVEIAFAGLSENQGGMQRGL